MERTVAPVLQEDRVPRESHSPSRTPFPADAFGARQADPDPADSPDTRARQDNPVIPAAPARPETPVVVEEDADGLVWLIFR